MNKTFLFLNFFLIGIYILNAQTSQQTKILNEYYQRKDGKIFKKIEREHIPLLGNAVNMIPYRVDDSFGFVKNNINGKTKWLIEPKFEQVFAVYKEGAIVKEKNEEGKWTGYGLISSKDKWLIKPNFINLFKTGDLYSGINTSTTESLSDFYDQMINSEDKNKEVLSLLDQIKPLRKDKDLGWKYSGIYWTEIYDGKGKHKFREFCHDFSTFSSTDSIAWFRYGKTITIRGKSGKIHHKIKDSEQKKFIGINNNTIIYAVPVFSNSSNETTYNFEGYTLDNTKKYTIQSPYRYIKHIENITQLSDTLFGLVLTDNVYHLVSSQGNFMPYGLNSGIAGIYESNKDFFNQDYFIVFHEDTKKYGVLDRTGQIIVPFNFDKIEGFSEGLSYAVKDKKPCFINLKGEIILSDSENTSLIRSIPTENIHLMLQQNIAFQEGLSLTEVANYYLRDTYETPKEGFIAQKSFNPKTGDSVYVYYGENPYVKAYFDKDQNIKIKLSSEIEHAGYFKDGLAPIMVNKLFGFIDKNGTIVIKPEYEANASGGYLNIQIHIPYFNGNFAYIKSWKGYIDRNGKKYYEGKRMQDKYNFSH